MTQFGLDCGNDDIGPFASRELAEIVATLTFGTHWQLECDIFRYAETYPEVCTAIYCRTDDNRPYSPQFRYLVLAS